MRNGFATLGVITVLVCYSQGAEEELTANDSLVSFLLRSRQPELVKELKPVCLRRDPVSGVYERVSSEDAFDGDGVCSLHLEPGDYQFEVMALDQALNRLLVIHALDKTVSKEQTSADMPDAEAVNLRCFVDGTALTLRQVAVRSIAPTGEIRWIAKDKSERMPAIYLSRDPIEIQLCLVGDSDRLTLAQWVKAVPLPNMELRAYSTELFSCETEPDAYDPIFNSGKGRMRFPDCTVEFPIRKNHWFLTNRKTGFFGYELNVSSDKKLVVFPQRVMFKSKTRLKVGGPLQPKPWASAMWRDDGKFFQEWSGSLVDAEGREVDLSHSLISYTSHLTIVGGREVPEGELSEAGRSAFDKPAQRLECDLAWNWQRPRKFHGAPQPIEEVRSARFTLYAPVVWRQRALNYLAELEYSHESWEKVSGRDGPIMTAIGWRANTHNAQSAVGTEPGWMSMPFNGLRENEGPYDYPWFMVYEMGNTFGYYGGAEMDAGVNKVYDLNDRARWRDVDSLGERRGPVKKQVP